MRHCCVTTGNVTCGEVEIGGTLPLSQYVRLFPLIVSVFADLSCRFPLALNCVVNVLCDCEVLP